jgi:hypothetical protein
LETTFFSKASYFVLIDLPHLEGPATSQNAPGDAGELVGEGDCQHVVMQPFPGRLEPGLEPGVPRSSV